MLRAGAVVVGIIAGALSNGPTRAGEHDQIRTERYAQNVVQCRCLASNRVCIVRALNMPLTPNNGLCDCDGDWGMFAPECPVAIKLPPGFTKERWIEFVRSGGFRRR